jgi:hypothetical protein
MISKQKLKIEGWWNGSSVEERKEKKLINWAP